MDLAYRRKLSNSQSVFCDQFLRTFWRLVLCIPLITNEIIIVYENNEPNIRELLRNSAPNFYFVIFWFSYSNWDPLPIFLLFRQWLMSETGD